VLGNNIKNKVIDKVPIYLSGNFDVSCYYCTVVFDKKAGVNIAFCERPEILSKYKEDGRCILSCDNCKIKNNLVRQKEKEMPPSVNLSEDELVYQELKSNLENFLRVFNARGFKVCNFLAVEYPLTAESKQYYFSDILEKQILKEN
jgi:hypothetical protein